MTTPHSAVALLAVLELGCLYFVVAAWGAIEDGQPGKGTGEHIACFILRADDR